MKHRAIHIIAVLFLATCAAQADYDTLRHYSPKSKLYYYRDTSIQMQAARFELPAPGYVAAVILTLDGDSVGDAGRVRLFGSEGGLAAPLLEFDLVAPVTFQKIRKGRERVTVILNSTMLVTGHQIFIAIDHLSPEVSLLTDRRPKRPTCVSAEGAFAYQQLKLADGEWRSGTYAYVIDAVIEFPKKSSPSYFADVTESAGLLDTTSSFRSLAWGDYDNSGSLDLLIGTSLYRNEGKGMFRNVTESLGLRSGGKAGCFVDLENDGDLDVVTIDASDSGRLMRFVNSDGRFTSASLPHLSFPRPTSLAVADANGDGYLDLFIGQSGILDGDTLHGALLLNDRSAGFTQAPSSSFQDSLGPSGSMGAQWVDINHDGRPDLFLTDGRGGIAVWRNNGDGSFANVADPNVLSEGISGIAIGGDWADYDNDGRLDLLLPDIMTVESARRREDGIPAVHTFEDSTLQTTVSRSTIVEYRYGQSSAVWGDVDNDGLLDFVSTVASPCQEAGLYRQQFDGRFLQSAFEYGLNGLALGPDAVWVDYDADGKLDLATFVNGRFRLYHNTAPQVNQFLSIELVDASGKAINSVGARITVYAGNRQFPRIATSGRGLLMQEPMRINIGIGTETQVDSVVVALPGSPLSSTIVRDVRVNEHNRLSVYSNAEAKGPAARLGVAYPNPFTASLTIPFTVPVPQHIKIDVYDLGGAHIATIANTRYEAGKFTAVWTPRDVQDRTLPQGTYIYRLTGETAEDIGRAVYTR